MVATVAARRVSPLARCANVATKRHGVISASEALAAGLSRDAMRRLVRNGSWHRLRPSVFALWVPTRDDDRWRQRLAAAAIWLGDSAIVSHRSAAMLWELAGMRWRFLEFSTIGRRRALDSDLIVHRTRNLAKEEITVRQTFRLTSVARTLVDLCAVTDEESVELALESALRARLVTIDQLRAALERSGRTHKGRGLLRSLLENHPGRETESPLEVRAWRLLRKSGLPVPVRQHEIRTTADRLIARVDFAYPERRIALEADGFRYHSSRKDWGRERARQNALVRLGWTVYRITWDDVMSEGHRVIADVAALLERSRERTPPVSEA